MVGTVTDHFPTAAEPPAADAELLAQARDLTEALSTFQFTNTSAPATSRESPGLAAHSSVS